MESLEKSPLLTAINTALVKSENEENGIRISITPEPIEQNNDDGSVSLIKCLCWNIIDADGNDVTDPVLAIVHADLGEEQISKDLENFFPEREYIVDNDIDIEDEEE